MTISQSDRVISRPSLAGQTAPAPFDPASFIEYYKRNYDRPRPIPAKAANWPELSATKKLALKRVVSQVAFGEYSEAQMAYGLVKRTKDETDRESLRLFAREEERHAQELFALAEQLELGLDQSSPDKGGQQMGFIAKLFNLGRVVDAANLTMVAEILSLSFYKQLANGVDHPLVKAVFSHIIKDEAGHLRYHAARVRSELAHAGFFNRLVLKLTHLFAVFITLLALVLTRPGSCQIANLSWKELLTNMETDYSRFFQGDMALFYSPWLFKLARLLP